MKVIDLLNKMANDREYRPLKIKFLGVIYTYNATIGDYENDASLDYGIFADLVVENILNDEVEVIEEKKK